MRGYTKKNKTVISEKAKQYYLQNREAIIASSKVRYLADHEKSLEYHRDYYAKNSDARKAYQKRYRTENPELVKAKKREQQGTKKTKARDEFRYAVRTGKIVRKPCIYCGDPKSQGHHEDYSKPLEVIWVCAGCHMKHYHRKKA